MAGASLRSENGFKFSKGPAIETYVGDITEAKADVLVVPEGVSFRGLGYIGRQMMELSQKFRKNREKLKAEKPLAAWDVYTSTLGGKRFKHVIHAIVVPCPDHNVEEWRDNMHLLYQRIFQEADRKMATVLAVPLLGTGRGGGRLEDVIEATVNSVANFKQTNLKRVLFVSNEEEIVCQIASRCEWERGHGGEGQKWRPLPKGTDVTYNHAKVKIPVQGESGKTDRRGSRPYSARERRGPTKGISGKQAPFHPPSTTSYGSKDTKSFHEDTKQRNAKGVKKDRQQEQKSETDSKARNEQKNQLKTNYFRKNDNSSSNKRALNDFISKRDMSPADLHPSHNQNAQWESESQYLLQLQIQQQQEQQQKKKELLRVNGTLRNTGDVSNRMLEQYSIEDHRWYKRCDRRQGHHFSDDSDENYFDEDNDKFKRSGTSYQDTHMPRSRSVYQNDLHQMSPHELSESQLPPAEALELNENGLPGRKNREKRQEHYCSDEAEENSSEEDNDENERTSHQDTHMPRPRGDYQYASHQMSPRELLESQLSPTEALELNENGLPGRKNREKRQEHYCSNEAEENSSEEDNDENESTRKSHQDTHMPIRRGDYQYASHQMSPRELFECQLSPAEALELNENGLPGRKNHGARPKENKKGRKMIHEETAYEPGENNVDDLYQISQRHQSKASVVKPKSRSALQEKDHSKSVGPSKLLETQGDKEQHEYDKPDQKNGLPSLKNHGARSKENKKGRKVIHKETACEPGENNVNDLYQISQRHQSKASVMEPKSRSALQEKDHFKSVGPSKLLETQGDKEQHEYDKPDQKNHGARPKENTKDQTMDTKNCKASLGKDICPICMCEITEPKRLDKCGHVFCYDCINNSFKQFKPVCPSCNMVYGEIRGNQPVGQMGVVFSGEHLPGYEGHGTITITYYFPSGTQGVGHPNPGQPYEGTTICAYLPDNKEGKAVLMLLRVAFDRKLTFTIRRSTTTGQENVVTWNDIHHKHNKDGGPIKFGYPDATYLQRVREELASKGVTDLNEPKRDENVKERPMHQNPGVVSTKDKQPIRRFEQRLNVPDQTKKKENRTKFADELKKLEEVARKKGFTVKETDSGQDLLTALSDQLSYVLREEIEPGHLRTVVARYLRTQSGKESNLGDFLIGTSLEDVITLIENGGNVDCQIFLNAASNSFGVEILLIFESGEEICFQLFSDKEFLPSLALGTVSNTRFFSLEHGAAGCVASDIPPTWSKTSKETELVTLQPHSQEYKDVEQSFFSSIGQLKHSVIQIKRVKSITQWGCYKITRNQMVQRLKDTAAETLLWHGTSVKAIKPICKEGFNRSHCGKNATRYGSGVYFSKASYYAAEDTYSVPSPEGFKFVFRARVLTGQYTKGESGTKVTPWLDEKELVRFDSVVDNVDRPSLFVIFHDNKAYPEYLIKFR